jgi:AsmA protein
MVIKKIHRNIGIGVAAFIALLLVLPSLINVNSFRPKIESELSNALGRKVEVGDLSLSILRGRVSATNISIADDPAFSKSPFLTAKSVKIDVELLPLIFSKKLNITGAAKQAISEKVSPAGKSGTKGLGGLLRKKH